MSLPSLCDAGDEKMPGARPGSMVSHGKSLSVVAHCFGKTIGASPGG
jgi:hypothetical protein